MSMSCCPCVPVLRPAAEFFAPTGFSRPQSGSWVAPNFGYFLGNYLVVQALALLVFSYFRPVFLIALLVPAATAAWIHQAKPTLPKEAQLGMVAGFVLLALTLGGKQLLVWSALGLLVNLGHAACREPVVVTGTCAADQGKQKQEKKEPEPAIKKEEIPTKPAAAAKPQEQPKPVPEQQPQQEEAKATPEPQLEPEAAAAADDNDWITSAAQKAVLKEFEEMKPTPEEQKRKKKADDDSIDLDDLKIWMKLISSLLDGNGESFQIDGLHLTLQELKEWREKYPDDEQRHDAYFQHCRSAANDHATQRGEMFEQASKAFDAGDKAKAAELSAEGHRQGELFRRANLHAALRLFWSRNAEPDTTRDRPDAQGNLPQAKGTKLTYNGAVDLHALLVGEAMAVLQGTMVELARRGKGPGYDVIPGRGSHSVGNKALIKPKVMDWLKARGFGAELDEAGGTIHVTF